MFLTLSYFILLIIVQGSTQSGGKVKVINTSCYIFISVNKSYVKEKKKGSLTLTMILRVSSLGKKTQTQRRSCIVLLLWKLSLFISSGRRRNNAGLSPPAIGGSGPCDDPPPPPLALTPPRPASDVPLQLQPRGGPTVGSAGQAEVTGQGMGNLEAAAPLERRTRVMRLRKQVSLFEQQW